MNGIIDKIDRQILTHLQKDASTSVEQVASRVNLSRNACWRRIKQMEENKIISGRVTLVNPQAVGLELTAFVLVRTSAHEPEWLEKFAAAVRELPEIVGAHRMSGDLDYILRVRLTNVKAYDTFYKRLISRVPLSDISASFVMDDIKDTTELPL
ncbi:transcriptional regulator [Chromatiales bacterium (ex Bugula neritina AB1)]|nr:transcriptional regulator [Chromatiales bacterium (ex Bugula neritina AB1)]